MCVSAYPPRVHLNASDRDRRPRLPHVCRRHLRAPPLRERARPGAPLRGGRGRSEVQGHARRQRLPRGSNRARQPSPNT
eukprot:6186544-Pleurochrysis_carterae.AAC.1